MSTAEPRGSVVVVDTNVFGADLVRRSSTLAERYRPHLLGRRFVVLFQTVAELRFGALSAGWGLRQRQRLDDLLVRAETVWAGPALLGAYVRVRVDCVRAGHALGQSDHDADRWIAATAVHLGVPLVSDDGVFVATPGPNLEAADRA